MTTSDMTTSDMTAMHGLAARHDLILTPDPHRVIIKLFVPGEDAPPVHTRGAAIVERIAGLDEKEIVSLLDQTLHRFGARHDDLEATFRHHYDLMSHRVGRASDLSPSARMLVGAYFSHEYAVEATALCNPSMVAHPDQSGLGPDQLRVAISLRQIGEGHISSIGFATGVLGPSTQLWIDDRSGPLRVGLRSSARHRHDLLAAAVLDSGSDSEVSATILGYLPEHFDDEDFERALGRLPADLLTRTTTHSTLEQLRRTAAESYTVTFPAEVPLSQRVLWPAAPSESNGMEDARFVKFVDDSGESKYYATYTAYDGHHIGARRLGSSDLLTFEVAALRGPAAQGKGMALFPRTVGGRYVALSRCDGETISLSTLDDQSRWQLPAPLHAPHSGWDLVQAGNCGSPIETASGWLVLTHGVGPMREYEMSAVLLDLDHPERVIAELPGVLLAPTEAERNGYVPNVVYSCGSLVHAGTLWIPYGASDTRVGFATVDLTDLIGAMASR
jgi:predicted GH43/DUF377 family glycosyl hydrolase